ncbi:MAG: FAD-dependent oxidoreductase [Planctomycetaceae bacterium]
MSRIAACLLLLLVSTPPVSAADRVVADQYDVVIYGATSAGIAAAVQVQRMGKSVVVVGPDKHLGGLTAGGLGWTDSGKKDAIGGIAREFYSRVWQHYQQPETWRWQAKSEFGNRNQSPPGKDGDSGTMWVFEPHVAEDVYEELVAEFHIPVHRDEWLNRAAGKGVELKNGRIAAITMLSGKIYRGKMFIDATYEGDLLAAAGVNFHVGREANSVYGETWNGIQVGILHHKHWFLKPVDPYVIPGDPNSGLLPRVSAEPPGERGAGDHRVQAYCYRMCLTDHDPNRIPFSQPQGYDAGQYELLLRVFATGWREHFGKFDRIQNFKTDTNNHGAFSTDNIGFNYDYPTASYARRAEILKEHTTYQQGLMYFMANDPRVPADVRTAMAKWGLPKDEFLDNGGWPHQIYVREARRMIGEYVMTEHDTLDKKVTPDSVGMGSYTLDSHNVQRYVTADGHVQNEGDIGVGVPRPYEIAYGSIVPKKAQCQNLLVPVCVSSSHIAFGSIRMEPVFMILGQSAATAAVLSIDANLAVQDLPYEQLRVRLLQDKQVLDLHDPDATLSRDFPGVVVDDASAKLTGVWSSSSTKRPFVDAGYQHDQNSGKGEKTARFETELKPGRAEVRLFYTAMANRATNVPVTIHHLGGATQVVVNQQEKPAGDGLSLSLGSFDFDGPAAVEISNTGTDGYVVIDAVQWLPQE